MFFTLTPAELEQLTGKRRADAQCRALDAMRIPYRKRPDGKPSVIRAQLEEAFAAPDRMPREPKLRL